MMRWRLVVGAILVVLLILPNLQGTATAVQVDATWNGGTGNWSVATNWTPNVVPNNNADTYNVLIDGGKVAASSVSLDIDATIDKLTIDAGDSLGIGPGRILTVASGVTEEPWPARGYASRLVGSRPGTATCPSRRSLGNGFPELPLSIPRVP